MDYNRAQFSAALPFYVSQEDMPGLVGQAVATTAVLMRDRGYRMLGLVCMEPCGAVIWLRFTGEPIGYLN